MAVEMIDNQIGDILDEAGPDASPFPSQADYEKFRETGEMPKREAVEGEKGEAKADGAKADGKAVDGDKPEPEAKADGDDAEAEKAEHKKRGGFQRKIEKLQAEIEALKAGSQTKQPAPIDPSKPTLDKFESIEAYTEALTDWKLAKAEGDRAAKAEATRVAANWEKSVEAGRAKHKDFDDIIESEVPITQTMRDALLESEAGGELAYWLGRNPDEAARIGRLSPIAQVRELAKQEAKLAAEEPPAKPQPRATKAPEPLATVGARAASSTNGYRPDMTIREYEQWRESGGVR